ncbi:DUF6247 family protein [Amycolatopsis sp. NPDC059657]|uniref:DUF6247 family protein n=1 Tax=Amycolatopsis sp. NPDC059657 TaxID=3346899 RepID=UPI003672EEDF
MASPAAPMASGVPVPPAADPGEIRACLSPRLLAMFDREWDVTLDQAKASKDLAGVHRLLQKWRGIAYTEMRDPGAYFRLLAKAERILQTGENPNARPVADLQAAIQERLSD